MPDPRLMAYANLCLAVMTAGLVLWLDMVVEALTGTPRSDPPGRWR
jgi:hypothetical protein